MRWLSRVCTCVPMTLVDDVAVAVVVIRECIRP